MFESGINRLLPSPPVTADGKSVAVLPFIDLTQSGDNAWFVDGLTEEILNSLPRLSDLKVIARTSSFLFKDQDRDIRAIAKTLDAFLDRPRRERTHRIFPCGFNRPVST